MHRFRHSHLEDGIGDSPKCVDKGKPPAIVENGQYPSPQPMLKNSDVSLSLPATAMTLSSQSDGADCADFAGLFETQQNVITTTISEIPGYTVQNCLGTVVGMSTRSRGFFPTLGAGVKTIVGGNIGALTKLVSRDLCATPTLTHVR
jgi:hypothetical protein